MPTLKTVTIQLNYQAGTLQQEINPILPALGGISKPLFTFDHISQVARLFRERRLYV